jgi:hypothetical protein
MFADFSFGATARGFTGVFAGFARAFFFGGMAARVLSRESCMGAVDGARAGGWRFGENL